MKNRKPIIDFNKDNQNQKSDNTITPTVAALAKRGNVAPGNTVILPVLGRNVTFTCKTIDANFVEKATMVYSDNIRLQELLDSESLSDILATMEKSGQQFPAIGREVNGVIEVADGSRRRKAAIIAKKNYIILVGDLTDKEMDYLSETGNDHRKPSAYELGLRYKRRLENEFLNTYSKLADDIKLDRKVIKRCVETATLPIEVIKCFATPNDLSARTGEKLAKIYKEYPDGMLMIANEIINKALPTDEIIAKFDAITSTEKEKPIERVFKKGIKAKYKGDSVTFSLKNAPESLIKQIEQLIEKSK